jgi:hypothetical protein
MRFTSIHFLACITVLHAGTDYKLQPLPAKLLSQAITEASGLAASPTNPDFLWVVNDSGGSTEVHLAGTDGTPHGSVFVSGVKNDDWEDLASFTLDGKPYLLIADNGDNSSKRESVILYIVAEPTLPSDGKLLSGEIPIAWKIDFTYSDGPRDCEAVAVDEVNRKILLINKRTEIPCVYELPLRPGKNPVARRIGTTETKATDLGLTIAFRDQPTGMDISADGSMAAVVTYYGVFLFQRAAAETWTEAFSRKPVSLGSHGLAQAESVAFAKDGKSIFAVSEKANSPIARYATAQ